jgi:hypothetical protein
MGHGDYRTTVRYLHYRAGATALRLGEAFAAVSHAATLQADCKQDASTGVLSAAA